MLRYADRNLELLAARQLHHALALCQHLTDLGLHRCDDAGGVGLELGVGEVVLGCGELALGLVDVRLRRRGERLALIEGLAHECGAAAQRLVALEIGLGARIVGFGRDEGGTGIVDGESVVGGVDAGDQLARNHDAADIDLSGGHLAGDAEAQDGFDPGHHCAGQQQAMHVRAVLDFGHARGYAKRWRSR